MEGKNNMKTFDFSGYATKAGLKCTDGRTITKDAFKEQDGLTVPLVWQHQHNDPSNVLGHALLEYREDGIYVYGKFNDTPAGKNAKLLVSHGDINALSIYANGLVEKAKSVLHGVIREVSLVLAGANPGAMIDNLIISHADGTEVEAEDEAIIYSGFQLSLKELKHEDTEMADENNETVEDVFNTLSEKQKMVVYAMLASVTEESEEEIEQSDKEGENKLMHKNIFDNSLDDGEPKATLTHAQFAEIMSDAVKYGSLKESFLAHVQNYGIENIDYLFPDAKAVRESPDFIKRETEWVSAFLSATHHSPFSRIKSLAADITADEARALGYVKGNLKKEEIIRLLKRVTTPTTVYKKQKLDRDDIIDITTLNVVAWLKAEMRVMLDEELARAALIGDGRPLEVAGSANPDKINSENIRPIYSDDDMYAYHVAVLETLTVSEKIDAIIRARKNYKGSGNPNLYTTSDFLTDMLLLKDTLGRRLYNTETELASALRVNKIVEVPVMDGVSREDDDVTLKLLGIIVNPKDYTLGADKGGEVSMFDDFDIDYNQYKYLLETRVSGALTMPHSALVIETTDEVVEEPQG